jgi:hypothetical protein
MNANSIYRDSGILMVGVLSAVVLAGFFVISSTEEPPASLADLNPYDAHRLLMAAEYARIADEWRLESDVTIAIGSGLTGTASDVLQRFGHPWTAEQSWEDNGGVPPPGTVLVRELRIDGETGFVVLVIGEVAGNLACGYSIESRYSWQEGWGSPDESSVVMC